MEILEKNEKKNRKYILNKKIQIKSKSCEFNFFANIIDSNKINFSLRNSYKIVKYFFYCIIIYLLKGLYGY